MSVWTEEDVIMTEALMLEMDVYIPQHIMIVIVSVLMIQIVMVFVMN